MGWDGTGWVQMGWDGTGWDGMGRDGKGRSGGEIGWDEVGGAMGAMGATWGGALKHVVVQSTSVGFAAFGGISCVASRLPLIDAASATALPSGRFWSHRGWHGSCLPCLGTCSCQIRHVLLGGGCGRADATLTAEAGVALHCHSRHADATPLNCGGGC